MFKNRSVTAFIAIVLALAYAIYCSAYTSTAGQNAGSSAEAAGQVIAALLVIPHLIITWVGVILGIIGFFVRSTGLLLTAAILFACGMFFFLLWGWMLIPSIVLGFIGYVQQKKIKANLS